MVGFIVAVTADAPTWTWFVGAATAGLFAPSIGSLVRARWNHVLGPGPVLQTAFSYESVVDELIFIVGPLLVAVLATQINPQAGLLTALALLAVGSAALAAHRASEPPPAPAHEHGGGSALWFPGMPLLVVVMFFIGGVFGGVEISAVAFADHEGRPELAGPLLACYATGSMLAGLAYGAIHWRVSLTRRLLLGALVMSATVALLPLVRPPCPAGAPPPPRRDRHRTDLDQRHLPRRADGAGGEDDRRASPGPRPGSSSAWRPPHPSPAASSTSGGHREDSSSAWSPG